MNESAWLEFAWALAISVAFTAGLLSLGWWLFGHRHFTRHERNPYRRHCKHCGGQQDVHYIPGFNNDWWECMDEGCDICNGYGRKTG